VPDFGDPLANEQYDALHGLTQMMTGQSELANQPGVVYALLQAKATPAEGQMIGQFLTGLEAQKKVELARANGVNDPAGGYITLTPTEKATLNAMGVQYGDVEWTPKVQADLTEAKVQEQSGGQLTVLRNKDGSLARDDKGGVVTVRVKTKDDDDGGFWGDIGDFFSSVGSTLWDGVEAVGHVVAPVYHILEAGLGGGFQSSESHAADMLAQGYEPGNPLSELAFAASGKAHDDLTPLFKEYGEGRVKDALRFNTDPDKFMKEIENDDSLFSETADGRKVMTAEGKAKVDYYRSDEFQTLQRKLFGQARTWGTEIANSVGIDPVDHPDAFKAVAVTGDVALSFIFDPLVVAGNTFRAAKIAQIGLKGLNDASAETAAKILTEGKGLYAQRVQRGWQDAIDLGNGIRSARAAGNAAEEGRLAAKFQSELPALAPIMEEFVGHNAFLGLEANGTVRRGALHLGDGSEVGIRSLEHAAEWVKRKGALMQLTYGRAATRTSVMPGAVSAYGYRRLKGAMSGWMSSRSTARLDKSYGSVVSRAEADPLMAQKWVDAGLLERMQPQANDYLKLHADNPVVSFKPDSVSKALGEVIGASREGRVESGIARALGEELDDLEFRLQQAMSAKDTDPTVLASLHDDIATGRQLLDMAEKGIEVSAKEAKAAETALARVEKTINHESFTFGGKSYDNAAKLKSAERGSQDSYQLTPAGKGAVQHGLRVKGNPTGAAYDAAGKPLEEIGAGSGFGPRAVSERFRLAATRLSTLLPRNTHIDITSAASGDQIYKYARTYLARGDASVYRARWASATEGERKVMLNGLLEQVAHAAGLGKTASGRMLIERSKNLEETYAANGVEIMLDGKPVALTRGQTRRNWVLPTFQTLQQASHKVGLWEATFGRALTSSEADYMMAQLKLGWLFKPSTITRNQLEAWLRTMLEGKLGGTLQMRAFATARNKELWNRGFGFDQLDRYKVAAKELASLKAGLPKLKDAEKVAAKRKIAQLVDETETLAKHSIVKHHLAVEAGDVDTAKALANATMLSGETLGRSSFTAKLVGEIAPSTKRGHVLAWAGLPLALAGRAYRAMNLKFMDEATMRALETMSPYDLAYAMEHYAQQVLEGTLGHANAAEQATKIAQAGLGPSTLKYVKQRALDRAHAHASSSEEGTRWTLGATTETIGADRYANHLRRLVDAQPETAKAIARYLEHKLAVGENPPLDDILSALSYEARGTAFGTVVAEDAVNKPGVFRRALTDAEREAGKQQWAEHMVREFEYVLKGENGYTSPKLIDYVLTHGKAPDGEWVVQHLKGGERPELVPHVETMALAPGGDKASMAQTLLDLEGSAYQWMVERTLQRTVSSPVFLVHYAEARVGMNSMVENLIRDAGLSRPAAEKIASESAVRQAWIKTEQLIDDPGQKTQFDVVARNFFPFARATNAMIRRWGTGLWQNPVAARRMMLAYEGAEHAGFIYNNQYGEPTFVYPASGAMNIALRSLSELPFVGELAQFPLAADMTGSTILAVPGADNPFRFSAGPMVMFPLRVAYKNVFPTSWRHNAEELDAAFNGPIGVGETWNQFIPTAARQFYRNILDEDADSAFASSVNGAFANLAAAGLIPPPDASPAEIKQFQARLQTQVRSQLWLRFAFGLFAPAAPSQPTEATSASSSDYMFSVQGIQGLSGEYKKILNDVDGDVARATAIFTAMHPDELVYDNEGEVLHFAPTGSAYTEGASGTDVKGAQLINTESALRWYQSNADFIQKYSTVSAYFIPKGSVADSFSQAAYDFELELGLRKKKAPNQFMADVYTRSEEGQYYAGLNEFDKRIDAAKGAQQEDVAKALKEKKAAWKAQYLARNPFLNEKLSHFGESKDKARAQIRDLKAMLAAGEVPGEHAALLGRMIQTWERYEEYVTTPGKTQEQKNAARQILDNWAADNVAYSPLADLYNGIFRTINNKLTEVAEGQYA
jgi:hypothetical protein